MEEAGHLPPLQRMGEVEGFAVEDVGGEGFGELKRVL